MYNQQNPMFEVKPVFRPVQTLVISLISSIFITMFLGSFLIPILGIAIGAIVLFTMPQFKDSIAAASGSEVELSQSDFQTFAYIFTSLPLLIGLALYLVAALIVYKSMKRTKSKTVYSFYEDHMLYSESYRTKNKTTVKYSSITSLDYSCSTFQERLGIGTISISTAGRSKLINISDIPNPDEIYQKIEELTGTKSA
ncbi:PH domain-containing protein [Paenibacillus taichungensis]